MSRRTVISAGRVLRPESTAIPELVLAVERGQVRVSNASGIIGQPAEVQWMALQRVVSGESPNLSAAVKRVVLEIAEREYAEPGETVQEMNIDGDVALHHSTVAGLSQFVESGSVDLVITFPPNSADSLALLPDLAAFAAYALKSDGVMVVLGDPLRLPETLELLRHTNLKWIAEFDYRHDARYSYTRDPHRLNLRRRPVLVYGKSRCRLGGGEDVLEAPSVDEDATGNHPGQTFEAGMELVVRRFARPGQVVCDPILLDRTIFALAARRYGCRFIGAFHDKACVDRVRAGLAREHDGGSA